MSETIKCPHCDIIVTEFPHCCKDGHVDPPVVDACFVPIDQIDPACADQDSIGSVHNFTLANKCQHCDEYYYLNEPHICSDSELEYNDFVISDQLSQDLQRGGHPDSSKHVTRQDLTAEDMVRSVAHNQIMRSQVPEEGMMFSVAQSNSLRALLMGKQVPGRVVAFDPDIQEIIDAAQSMVIIKYLTEEEGSAVSVINDNPDPCLDDRQSSVGWSEGFNRIPHHFYGKSTLDCLRQAEDMKRST